jgi:hypothetical protein
MADVGIGSTTLATEVLVVALDQPKTIDARIEGVLGQSFLSRIPCLIADHGRRLYLGDEAVHRAGSLAERFTARRLDGRLAIDVGWKVGAPPLRLVLDSGAPALVLLCGRACPEVADASEVALMTNSGSRRVLQGTLESVTVGGMRISRPSAVVVDGAPAIEGEDGLIPTRWFSAVYLGPGNVVALAH